MTEQEIIDYLKNNFEAGVAFGFMPKEVKEWCKNNSCKLIYYQPNDLWDRNSAKEYFFVSSEIVALPEDFDIVPKSESGWVEFEIEDSCFAYSHSVGTSHLFDWFDWVFFLKASKKQGWGFTAFGGWQYKNCKAWFIQPMLLQGNHHINCEFENETCKVEPDIPVKIRFWRENELSK